MWLRKMLRVERASIQAEYRQTPRLSSGFAYLTTRLPISSTVQRTCGARMRHCIWCILQFSYQLQKTTYVSLRRSIPASKLEHG